MLCLQSSNCAKLFIKDYCAYLCLSYLCDGGHHVCCQMIPDWKLIENKDVSSLISRCGVESTKIGLMNPMTSLPAAMKVCKLKRYSFWPDSAMWLSFTCDRADGVLEICCIIARKGVAIWYKHIGIVFFHKQKKRSSCFRNQVKIHNFHFF